MFKAVLTRIVFPILSVIVCFQVGFCRPAKAGEVDMNIDRFDSLPVDMSNHLDMKTWVLFCADKAMASLQQALMQTNDYDMQVKLRKNLESLKHTRIEWPDPDEDDLNCIKEAHVSAYVRPGHNFIYFCKSGFNIGHGNAESVAQVLIHESTHLWQPGPSVTTNTDAFGDKLDMKKECEATEVEIYTATHSSLGVQFQTEYVKMCGIKIPDTK